MEGGRCHLPFAFGPYKITRALSEYKGENGVDSPRMTCDLTKKGDDGGIAFRGCRLLERGVRGKDLYRRCSSRLVGMPGTFGFTLGRRRPAAAQELANHTLDLLKRLIAVRGTAQDAVLVEQEQGRNAKPPQLFVETAPEVNPDRVRDRILLEECDRRSRVIPGDGDQDKLVIRITLMDFLQDRQLTLAVPASDQDERRKQSLFTVLIKADRMPIQVYKP